MTLPRQRNYSMSEDGKNSIEESSKFFLIGAAFVAFFLVFVIGFVSGNEITHTLQNASIAAVLVGALMKFCLHVIESNIEKVQLERYRQKVKTQRVKASERLEKITQRKAE